MEIKSIWTETQYEAALAETETLYLLNIPGMRKSIVDGLNTLLDECDDEIEW
jgi:hypothetical protein